jgi:ABC-type multidrug transport system ATPase subunit
MGVLDVGDQRYRKVTALTDCTITVPEGRISALIGPNGAGKTTLLRVLAGLAKPSVGDVAVLGGTPRQDPAFLAEIGFVAQEIPLYRRLSAEDHIAVGAHLDHGWDAASVQERLNSLNIPLGQPVGTLSGGQRAQVALSLTLAKRPRLLLLDEPVAALDPLARRHFLATLADAVAAGSQGTRNRHQPVRHPGHRPRRLRAGPHQGSYWPVSQGLVGPGGKIPPPPAGASPSPSAVTAILVLRRDA